MAIGETAAALIGAGIGAGGAVLAQVTASIFSGRRDTKRFLWDQDKDLRAEKERQNVRFLELKHELYSEFSSQTAELAEYLLNRKTLSNSAKILASAATLNRITLVAPTEVAAICTATFTRLLNCINARTRERVEMETKAAMACRRLAFEAMKTDLLGNEFSAELRVAINDASKASSEGTNEK
jgi:hypothetical protein